VRVERRELQVEYELPMREEYDAFVLGLLG